MKKTQLMLCSHGNFARELVKSAEMIVGKVDNIEIFSLMPGMSMEDFQKQITDRLQTMSHYDELLFLVDLYGGTPCTAVMSLMKQYPINIVTGLNLAMLIEVNCAMAHGLDASYVELAEKTLKNSGKIIKFSDFTK